jgi:hypothetical protein
MPDHEKAKLDAFIASQLNRVWKPVKGPQLAAYLCEADVLLYGGAAGGGKTDLALGLAINEHERCLLIRRQIVDLRGAEDRLQELVGTTGYNSIKYRWRDPANPAHIIEFGGLKDPGSEKDYQGRPHDLIVLDEAAQLIEARVEFILGWLRSATGKRCRAILSTNPPNGGDGTWLLEWFKPWLDPMYPNPAVPGEIRWAIRVNGESIWVDGPGIHHVKGEPYTAKSYTYIPARLADNPYLRDTGYRATIEAMPEPLRSQLLYGDFTTSRKDHPQQVIPQSYILAAQQRWKADNFRGKKMDGLGVDVAFGGSDDVVIQPVYDQHFPHATKKKGINVEHSSDIAGPTMHLRKNACAVGIDVTGGWGIAPAQDLDSNEVKVYRINFSKGTAKKQTRGGLEYANFRSLLWWEFREDLDPMSEYAIELPPDPKVVAQLMAPMFKTRSKKIYIESKDDIRKRLGSSTDEADAIIIAWYVRKKKYALRNLNQDASSGNINAQKPIVDPFQNL